MKVGELKEQLSKFDDEMEIFYNEPILGAVMNFEGYTLVERIMIQLKNGDWFTLQEFDELKKENTVFDSDILIKKKSLFLLLDDIRFNEETEIEEL